MAFLQFFRDLSGATKRQERRIEQEQERQKLRIEQAKQEHAKKKIATAARDIEIADFAWTHLDLPFRPHGYDEHDWIASPAHFPQGTNLLELHGASLIRMNLHPLACYRALGLSHIVDHWVPRIATEGWAKLTENFGPFIRLGPPRQWGHIEHPAFWSEVTKMLALNDTTGSWTQGLLRHAGWAGNTVPFEAVARHHVEQYSKTASTCHPKVALWLNAEGLWTKEQLVPSMGPWKDAFPLAGHAFMGWTASSHITVAYVREWLDLMLMHYPLSQEQQVNLAGQAILAFGAPAWEKMFAASTRAYLTEIDMDLLYAVCDVNKPLSSTSKSKETKEEALRQTVTFLTQDIRSPFSTEPPSVERLKRFSGLHENLLLLSEIQPPQSRAELYMLALMARNMDRGLVAAPEVTPLPDLMY